MMTSVLICPSPFFGISPLVLFMFHPLNNYEESQIVTTLSSLGSNLPLSRSRLNTLLFS
jgi:hypothetical protein